MLNAGQTMTTKPNNEAMKMNDSIPELKIEFMNDGTGQGLILLEQDSCGNIERVAIHPIHLRYMAEQFGLVNTGDPDARKTIAALTRRLHLLHDRIDHLAYWLTTNSDHKHADLSYEMTYATATAEIADDYCFDLEGAQQAAVTSNELPRESHQESVPMQATLI